MSICGNKDCEVSTGVYDHLTFGSGELDENGFWEYPCEDCARHHEIMHDETPGTCWPHNSVLRVDAETAIPAVFRDFMRFIGPDIFRLSPNEAWLEFGSFIEYRCC